MYERFTEEAMEVVILAQDEARRLGTTRIGTGQLLLALIRERNGIAAKGLSSLGVTLEDARIEVEKEVSFGREIAMNEAIFYDLRVEAILFQAEKEASQLRSESIGTGHLLLSLIQEEDTLAVSVLRSMGIELSQVRTEILPRLNE